MITPDQDLIRKVDQLRAEAERRSISSCKRGDEEWKESYFNGQVDAYNRVHRFLTTGEWET